MFSLTGIDTHIENIYKLAAPHIRLSEPEKIHDLRFGYIEYLRSVHKEFPIYQESGIIVHDQSRARVFASALSASTLNDLNQERMVGEPQSGQAFDSAVNLLKLTFAKLQSVNPELKELFDVTVHSILLCESLLNGEGKKGHGGTTNKCIGLMWLNLNPNASVQNVAEMLVHELMHTLVFIDELNYGHFHYENLGKKEFWATSAILKRARPMDKVYHSILVSLEILMARNSYLPPEFGAELFHPDSASLKANSLNSIVSMLNHPRLDEVCQARVIEMIEKTRTELLQL